MALPGLPSLPVWDVDRPLLHYSIRHATEQASRRGLGHGSHPLF